MAGYRKFEDVQGQATPDDATEQEPSITITGDEQELPPGTHVVDNADGGVSILEIEAENAALGIPDDLPFDANLAEYIQEDDLTRIGSDILDKVKADIESNSEWRDAFNNGLKFLGFKPEDRDQVFKGASGAWDSKLLEALVRFHAEIFAELFPADGPTKTRIAGQETPDSRDRADRVKMWMNYYLTTAAREYYDDSDQMLNYALLAGSVFRKVYICPLKQRPVAKYLDPNQVAMPYSATGIYDTPRFAAISEFSAGDLRLMQISKFYRDVDIQPLSDGAEEIEKEDQMDAAGVEKVEATGDCTYQTYEVMLDYDLCGFEHCDDAGEYTELPLPYKITVGAMDGTVLRIERNWDEKKAQATGLYERQLNISHWKFMPGFGPFGIGLISCLGGPAEMRTKLKRMLHDAGIFSNFPPTIRVKGLRMERNTGGMKPGENMEIDTGGMPVGNAIQQMNTREPSQMLKALFDDEGTSADRIIGNMDIAVGDGRQDAPVGTTIALLQAAKKPQTGVMRRLHRALTHELQMFFDLFGIWLPETPYPFPVPGQQGVIMRQDFNETVMVSPVSDPNVMSQTERMMRAEQIMKISAQVPPNAPPYVVEAARRMYQNMNIDNIDTLLPAPQQELQPTDPVTENMAAMTGGPLKAFIQQNHDAHMAVHQPMMQQAPSMQAHMAEHMAMKYRLMVENQIGGPLPPEGTPMPPQQQEQIAMMVAKATQQWMDEQAAKQPKTPTMEEVMMADVQQKRDKELLRHVDAMNKIKAEEQMAAQKSDDEAAKRASSMDIARMKTAAGAAADETIPIKVAHIKAAAEIESARMRATQFAADKDGGSAAYSNEADKE